MACLETSVPQQKSKDLKWQREGGRFEKCLRSGAVVNMLRAMILRESTLIPTV